MQAVCPAQLADQGIFTGNDVTVYGTWHFYEIKGIASMEAEHANFIHGWRPARMPFDPDVSLFRKAGSAVFTTCNLLGYSNRGLINRGTVE